HEDRINNVRELVTAMGEFENLTETDNLSAFLAEVSLMTDVDAWSGDNDAITLMTLHSAKGLEFPSVYIVGVEKGLFPLSQSFESEGEIEEERRLFYVGITRARERLHVSYAVSRMRYGSYSGGASLFVAELPEDLLDFESSDRYTVRGAPVRGRPVTRTMEFEDYPQETPDDGDGNPFQVGMYVRHPKFGRGKVTACYGSGEKTVLTISFAGTVKNIMPAYVRLVPA
ncbi:MAG: ATP-binding domain-containing protein, partial [Candidatus Latescibacteria bacterium]|nr:ATP-binding domain-containing protein [Candidatus Latescibacterota bacterium]